MTRQETEFSDHRQMSEALDRAEEMMDSGEVGTS